MARPRAADIRDAGRALAVTRRYAMKAVRCRCQRRIPKRGFRRLQKNEQARERFVEVNVSKLAGFLEGETIDPAVLVDRGLVRPGRKIKVLGGGDLKSQASDSGPCLFG